MIRFADFNRGQQGIGAEILAEAKSGATKAAAILLMAKLNRHNTEMEQDRVASNSDKRLSSEMLLLGALVSLVLVTDTSHQHKTMKSTNNRQAATDAIMTEIGKQLDDVVSACPVEVSEEDRQKVKAELIVHCQHVLSAVSREELESPRAFDAFLESITSRARMMVNELAYQRRRKKKS